jgi:hypothetical protein
MYIITGIDCSSIPALPDALKITGDIFNASTDDK